MLTFLTLLRALEVNIDLRHVNHSYYYYHICEIVKEANQRAALIHLSFLSKNPTNLILAYKIYVRPLLEYASPVWNPSQINLINTLEAVQRKFTKRIPGLSDIAYSELYEYTAEPRRRRRSKMAAAVAELIKRRAKRRRRRTSSALNRLGV